MRDAPNLPQPCLGTCIRHVTFAADKARSSYDGSLSSSMTLPSTHLLQHKWEHEKVTREGGLYRAYVERVDLLLQAIALPNLSLLDWEDTSGRITPSIMQRLALSAIKHLKLSGVTIDDAFISSLLDIIEWPLRTLYLDLVSPLNQLGKRNRSLAVAKILRLCSLTLESLVVKSFRATEDRCPSAAGYVKSVLCFFNCDRLVL